MVIGAIITAVGLQFFLLPNHLLDGGVTGISIISAKLSGVPLGVFLALFNIPFVLLGLRKFGKEFAAFSLLGIIVLASLTMAHVDKGFVTNSTTALVVIILRIGVRSIVSVVSLSVE